MSTSNFAHKKKKRKKENMSVDNFCNTLVFFEISSFFSFGVVILFYSEGKINQTRNFIQLLIKCKMFQEVMPEKKFRNRLFRYISKEKAFHLILIFPEYFIYWELLIMKCLLITVNQLSRKISLPVYRDKSSRTESGYDRIGFEKLIVFSLRRHKMKT